MANVINIYPIADTSLAHSKYPNNSANGFSLINNVTSDGDTTYIYKSLNTTNSTTTSKFKCGDNNITGKIYLISAETSVIVRNYSGGKNASYSTQITTGLAINNQTNVNGTAHATTGTDYQQFNDVFSTNRGLNTIYNSINDANIVLTVASYGKMANNNGSGQHRITSAYVTIEYDDVFQCQAFSSPGSGITNVTVSATDVRDGGTCTFTATVNNRYVFSGWYSDEACTQLVSSNRQYTHTVTGNTILYAKGTQLYTVTVYGDEHCTTSASTTQDYYNTPVTVTATLTDNNRYKFDGWYINPEHTTLVSMDNPYTFNLRNDTVLYAATDINETAYIKLDGKWEECFGVYKKIDGHWELQQDKQGLFDINKNYKPIKIN